MGRKKRKRTPAELQEAIAEATAERQSEHDRGQPTSDEERKSKRKRVNALTSKICRLKKQLKELQTSDDSSQAATPESRSAVEPQSAAERQRTHRSTLSQEERAVMRDRDAQQHRAARSALTPEEQASQREQNTLLRQELRHERTAEEIDEERERDRLQHEAERVARDEEARESAKEAVRIRKKCVRHGHALENHENFDKSNVKGKDVEDGRHKITNMFECIWCGAWKWPGESEVSCCLKGKVRLPPLQRAPSYLLDYYDDPIFRRYIRAYNQVFAFTSIGVACNSGGGFRGVREDTSVQGQRGVYTYRIQGAMGHYLGSLSPRMEFTDGQLAAAKFAQIYFIDDDLKKRALRRKGIFADLDTEKLTTLERMMEEYNPFAQQFISHGEKHRRDIAEGRDVIDVVYNLHADKRRPGTTNLPTVNEVGAVMVDDGNFKKARDIHLHTKQNGLMRIYETNPMYDPLQYPLLFPNGDLGWTYTDTYADGQQHRNKEKMSLREHTAFRLFPKPGDGAVLHEGGRLFQQWCVDLRAKVEQEFLRWVSDNQATLRADLYSGVQDAYLNETTAVLTEGAARLTEYNRENPALQSSDNERESHFLKRIGKRIVLPATFTGGPRHMYRSFQDSMAIVREYGKPDIFLTMTCNPEWEEIRGQLREGQTAQDRPDIVARVWQLKLRALLNDLDQGVLGRVVARIYVVEFQKRGLPHAHILLILADEDKPRTREIIDKLVSAEIPDEATNPELYKTVTTCMMHGPCGNQDPTCVCMKDGKCSKNFPKPLCEITRANVDGYPEYKRRRRAPGVLKIKNREYDNETANQWVVPYNPYFSQKYNCHINVEVCTGITAVKYLYKYVYKGSDKAVITVEAIRSQGESVSMREEPNEVLRYLSARYLSPVEACMRLLDYGVQGKSHSVEQLTVHLEGRQMVVYNPDQDTGSVLENGQHTMLTRFFELCASTAPENQIAKTMLYQDIPKKFCWKNKQWVRRKNYRAALGRMIHVSPRDQERFYLRVLLCHRKGPTSFDDLKTVNNTLYPTFHDAAMGAGYLDNDVEWHACLSEAAAFQMPYQLRQLFATLLVYSMPSDVRALWDAYYDDLSQDFAYKYRSLLDPVRSSVVMFETLKNINELLQVSGSAVQDYDLPQLSEFPRLVLASLMENTLIRRELTGYNESELEEIVNTEDHLNNSQKEIYDEIVGAVNQREEGKKLFFIDGPGGTGKSTLLRHLLAKVRLDGKIAIAVASSGIASLLLMGGRTAHSTFKIPLKLDENSTCNIFKQSHLRKLIERAALVIWDEAPMTHRHAFEAVDRTLRDIMSNDREPFGGKVFVLSGDFRQILPVVKRGTPADTIDACLKSSDLWRHFKQVRLTENMRVRAAGSDMDAEEMAEFSEFLLKVGEGRHDFNPALGRDSIKIPSDMLIDNPPDAPDDNAEIAPGAVPRGMERLIDHMYADVNNPDVATDEYFASRTILTTTNALVHRINEVVADRLPETAHEYRSVDALEDDKDGNFFEQEVLNSVNINGIPPHRLVLKKGIPIMMMRNLNPDLGLCNGTRLRIVDLRDHVIHATIMTGERKGQHVLIPRIIFVSDDDTREFPLRLRRKQFPVQPAFAMTINKAQGQTVMNLGLYLYTPCFSHGQLYVAMSRVTSRSKFKAVIEYPELEEEDGLYTSNIVYRQIFN